jgi:uroporphyrin-III C-methyltransferase/precorrin-2 dehydrogenase/sirohydrochlorin ferrochelatase
MSLAALPIFVKLAGRPVILIGEGEAAEAKRRLLERAGAMIVDEQAEAALAIVATENLDPIVARLRARGVLVNAVDRPDLCDFTLPAIVDRAGPSPRSSGRCRRDLARGLGLFRSRTAAVHARIAGPG